MRSPTPVGRRFPTTGPRRYRRKAPRLSGVFGVLDASGLAGQIAQVEEARATDEAAAHDFDLLDARRVRQEHALDADVEADLPHGEGAAGAVAGALENHTLEDLDAIFVAFDDLVVNPNGVP